MKIILAIVLCLFAGLVQAFEVTVTYSWDSNSANDYVTMYQVEHSQNGGPWTAVSNVLPPSNSITITIPDSAAGDVLAFHVNACNVVGCSAFSPGVSATVPPNLVPGIPTGEQILPMAIAEAIE